MQLWEICFSYIICNIWSSKSHKKTEAIAKEVWSVPLSHIDYVCQHHKVLHDLLCPLKLMLRADIACGKEGVCFTFMKKKLGCLISWDQWISWMCWAHHLGIPGKPSKVLGLKMFWKSSGGMLQTCYHPCAPEARPFGLRMKMICWGILWKPVLPQPVLHLFSEVNRKPQTSVTSILNFSQGLNSVWKEKSSRNDLCV